MIQRLVLGLLLTFCVSFGKEVWVEGYKRKDGRIVKGHWRTVPDSVMGNNYSTEGNVNPHTLEPGTLPNTDSVKVLKKKRKKK